MSWLMALLGMFCVIGCLFGAFLFIAVRHSRLAGAVMMVACWFTLKWIVG